MVAVAEALRGDRGARHGDQRRSLGQRRRADQHRESSPPWRTTRCSPHASAMVWPKTLSTRSPTGMAMFAFTRLNRSMSQTARHQTRVEQITDARTPVEGGDWAVRSADRGARRDALPPASRAVVGLVGGARQPLLRIVDRAIIAPVTRAISSMPRSRVGGRDRPLRSVRVAAEPAVYRASRARSSQSLRPGLGLRHQPVGAIVVIVTGASHSR